jgi:hypothetical protein
VSDCIRTVVASGSPPCIFARVSLFIEHFSKSPQNAANPGRFDLLILDKYNLGKLFLKITLQPSHHGGESLRLYRRVRVDKPDLDKYAINTAYRPSKLALDNLMGGVWACHKVGEGRVEHDKPLIRPIKHAVDEPWG